MAGNLTGKQDGAILALLTASSMEEGAKTAGIGVRTLFRWLSDPFFSSAYREARRQAVQRATGRLQQAASDAVTTLRDVMKDPEAPAPARVNAAKSVLELAVKAVEVEDLAQRIEKLEAAAAERPR